METSTRVFVSGLPPTCSNDQLRNHFATRFQVTDAHVLPKRRMGFVGFKDHEAAQNAVKYFNKTFLKMSKISVDIARPVCDTSPRLCSQSSCLVFFLLLLSSPLTSSVGLETDKYIRRLIPNLSKELTLHGNVMQPTMPRHQTTLSARERMRRIQSFRNTFP